VDAFIVEISAKWCNLLGLVCPDVTAKRIGLLPPGGLRIPPTDAPSV